MVCVSVSKHKNNALTAENVSFLWTLYCKRVSNRTIAKKIGVSEPSIRRVIIKIKEWMDLL